MRLVEKYTKLRPDTFAPEMVVTVALPMEIAPVRDDLDDASINEINAAVFEKIGNEFIDIIKTGKWTDSDSRTFRSEE
jgi:hypothetical protein